MVLNRVIQSKLVQDTTKKVLKEVDEIKEASKAKKIKKLEEKKPEQAEILKKVDELVTSGKAENPERLLQNVRKRKVKVDGKVTEVADSETVLVKTKAKQPKVSKETEQEFFESWGIEKGRIGPNILKDFNIKNIKTNDDIYRLINAISKSTSKKIDKQKRGVRKTGTTRAAATRLQNSSDFLVDVLNKKPGDTYNAEQILAIREMLVAGKNRLLYLANKAQDPINSTADDVLKFRQHFALMAQIQKVLKGVQTETARALQQFRIPTRTKQSFIGGNIDDLNKDQLLVELGGVDEIRRIARVYVQAPADDAAKLKAIEKTGLMSFSTKASNAIAEVFINAILSNPLTHVRNTAGNWITQAIVMQERKLASRYFGGLNRGSGSNYIDPNEDIAKAWGQHMASKEIMASMKNAFKIGGSKIDQRLGQFTAQNFGIKKGGIATTFDVVGTVATLGNLPTKFLTVADDYFKNREFRSEVYALSFSEGMEMYNKGLLAKADIPEFIAGRVANPTKEIMDAAYKKAQYVTFQTPLGKRGDLLDLAKVGQTVKNYSSTRGPWSWLINYYLPFVRTPTNIAGFVAERTPVVAQVLTRYNKAISEGGRAAAEARAKLALGSAFYLATAPLGYYGVTKGSDLRGAESKITGGKSLLKKTIKSETFSINIPLGDGKFQKVSFRGFDPVAQLFANSANMGQMLSMLEGSIYNNIDPDDPLNSNKMQIAQDVAAYTIAFTFSIGENLSDSTMLAGAGKLTDDARKISRGYQSSGLIGAGRAFKEVGSEMLTSYVPTIARQTGKLFNDEHQKIATSMKEYFKRNIKEGGLENDYDARGRKYDKFVYFNQYEKDELDEELENVFPSLTPVRNYISYKYDAFGNSISVPLKSNEKRFLRKNTGLIFNDNLKKLVQEDFYKNETRRAIKQGLIEAQWSAAKSAAKEGLLTDTAYDDGEGNQINYFKDIKVRAEDLAQRKINNSQRGFINDNINNNNQE